MDENVDLEIENPPKFVRESHAQNKVMKEIDNKNSQIANMRALQNSGLSLVSHQEMKKLVDEKKSLEKQLKRLKRKAKWEKERRLKVRDTIVGLSKSSEENAKALKSMTREVPGRPRIETDQPQLLKTILGEFGLIFSMQIYWL